MYYPYVKIDFKILIVLLTIFLYQWVAKLLFRLRLIVIKKEKNKPQKGYNKVIDEKNQLYEIRAL